MATVKNAAKKVETLVDDAQKAATEGYEKLTKGFEDIAAFNQDNVDAIVKSSGIAVKAVEELNAEIVSFSKKSVEEGVAAAKELSAIKTMPELLEKQTAFAKSSVDDFMKQATKFNELAMAAAKDVFEPMNARATAAADLVKSYRV